MANPFYTASGYPSTFAPGASASARAEFAAISAAFDKLPALGTPYALIRQNAAGTALESTTSIDGIAIGATTPAAGTFTDLRVNNKVGVGGAATDSLDVQGTGSIYATVRSSAASGVSAAFKAKNGTREWQFGVGPGRSDDFFTVYDATAAEVRLAINGGGNVLLGVSTVGVTGNGNTVLSMGNGQPQVYVSLLASGGQEGIWGTDTNGVFFGAFSNNALTLRTNNTERMRIDASGYVGIGKTPAAWSATFNALEVGVTGAAALWASAANVVLSGNAYYDGQWKYAANNYITAYQQLTGNHIWYRAASGLAGNVAPVIESMRIDVSGQVGIGISPAYKLHVYGNGAATADITAQQAAANSYSRLILKGAAQEWRIVNDETTTPDALVVYNLGLARTIISINASTGAVSYDDGNGANEIGYRGIPLVGYTGASTLQLSDRGKAHYKTDATQVTVPTGVFAAGDSVMIYNWNAGAMTIVQGAGLTMYKGGSSSTGNRTLAGTSFATVVFNATGSCIISGAGLS